MAQRVSIKEVMAINAPLLTEEIGRTIPPLYANEERVLAALAVVKPFLPGTLWTWYVSEYDGEDICFGLVIGLEAEVGYFSLAELRTVRGPFGLKVERDLHFDPAPLQDLKAFYDANGWAR